MLASYVGEDRFLKGVSLYLKKHTFNNTVTKDLWEGIQAATSAFRRCSCLGVYLTNPDIQTLTSRK